MTKGKSGVPGADAFPIGAMAFSWLMSYSSSVAGRFGHQNLNLTCCTDRRLSADSENPVPRSDMAAYGWFAWPNRGDLTFPKTGPQLENLFIDATSAPDRLLHRFEHLDHGWGRALPPDGEI